MDFIVPFAVETSGVLGEAAKEFMGTLNDYSYCKTTGPESPACTVASTFYSTYISISVLRGNVAAVLGTMGRLQLDISE